MKIVEIEPIFTTLESRQQFEKSLNDKSHELISHSNRPSDKTDLINRVKKADIILMSNIPLDGEIINQCENLKMISVAFTGIDHIDVEACNKREITIRNSAGYSTNSVAELTLGLIIDSLRKITYLDAKTRSLSDRNGFIGSELKGKTVGINGSGAIGTQVGIIMNTLGCKVLFTSRSIKPDTSWGKFTSIDALLAESDIVTLHTPLTPETEFLIDENKISKMKETAFLINTARGKVVDYNALADALTKGKLAGAAIDVYEMEPPISKNHPLLTAPNCILTPHIAYATKEALTLRAKIASENIINWLGE